MFKNKKFNLYLLIIILLPFLIMLLLHIGIALGQYFNININVHNISASDWFMFAGSYLGGVITLFGVIITIKEERKLHKHQIMENDISKEQEKISKFISQINIHSPSMCYSEFKSILRKNKLNDLPDFTLVYNHILEELKSINQLKSELFISTNIYNNYTKCNNCKISCNLPNICKEFYTTYEDTNNKIYDTLCKMQNYIYDVELNATLDNIILNYETENSINMQQGKLPTYTENQINDLKNQKKKTENEENKLNESLEEISKMALNELPKLMKLSKDYIYECKRIASQDCFNNK